MKHTVHELAIERVVEENFHDFCALIEKLAEYERLDPPDDEAKARLKNDGLSDNPRYEAYLGRVGGEAVSYAVFFQTYSSFLAMPTLYLEDIFVLEEFRRAGLGQRMFEFCVKKAGEKGCGRMEWCVLDWNQPAIDFYEKNKANRLNWIFYRLTQEEIARYLDD
jgi:GNAT superfamily N-acetyltransferase